MIKSSRIWEIPKEEFQLLLDNSSSYSEILRKLNYNTNTGGAYKTILKRIQEENFSVKALNQNRKAQCKNNFNFIKKAIHIDNILMENSKYPRHALKKRLIKENMLEYKCSSCGISNSWNNKELSLHLDHINGINNDNRIDNLRFLCPNCHSQTETYAGKKNKKVKSKPTIKELPRKSKRKFEISKEELINLIKQYPMTKVGEILGVSDNAVRKRCKILEIDYKNL